MKKLNILFFFFVVTFTNAQSIDFVPSGENINIPIVDPEQNFCGSTTVENLHINDVNAIIKWYSSETGGTPLNSSFKLTSGIYYASQIIDGNESTRTPVFVTINYTNVPNVRIKQKFRKSATVADLKINNDGASTNWYNSAISAAPISASTPLTSGTYYVSQILNGCESDRVSVLVSVKP